ncbi:AAA-ATPase At4g30250-like [Magnolia sinica]|uniref:AAA-ATPase At4g30250-like n=1 Tax=Magnolia sinica TaxID=86752 RepID=UPI00265A7680|nr:AAA-ATPase At4g30250-like [Magnolia sinica]
MEILSQMWSFLGLLTVLQNVLPSQLLSLLHSLWESLQDSLSPYSYFEIPEFNGYCGVDVNDLYRHVTLYLNSLDPSTTCRRLTLTRPKNSTRVSFTVAPNHTLEDTFMGHRVWWTHHIETVQDSLEEKRSFCLRMPKRDRTRLLPSYLDSISARAEEFERVSRERRLYTNTGHGSYESGWASVPFRHPSTFDTLALDPDLKDEITSDLTAFSNGRDFYHRVGRSWKRGYLLYGPPGSGKSSLIAAMANYLRYDVYDLELTKVSDNSELRALLIQTTNRSMIVIEDIDCSLDLTADRVSKKARRAMDGGDDDVEGRVTLSGLLNFTDGLWSCCGEERIIVFTTNHRDSVDPALVRYGRMDVHVRLGSCGFYAFKVLAGRYLGVDEHVLFHVVESSMRAGGALTTAEVGEILLRNRRDADVAIRAVISALQGSLLEDGGRGGDLTDGSGPSEEYVGRSDGEDGLSLDSPGGKRRKVGSTSWEKKVRFLVKLKGLTKSDSGRRGV